MRSNTKLLVKINTSEPLASSPASSMVFDFRTRFTASLKFDDKSKAVASFHSPIVALIVDSELFQLVEPNSAPEASPIKYNA